MPTPNSSSRSPRYHSRKTPRSSPHCFGVSSYAPAMSRGRICTRPSIPAVFRPTPESDGLNEVAQHVLSAEAVAAIAPAAPLARHGNDTAQMRRGQGGTHLLVRELLAGGPQVPRIELFSQRVEPVHERASPPQQSLVAFGARLPQPSPSGAPVELARA